MTIRTLVFQPMISPALWVLLAVGGLGAWAWYGWRRPAGLGRRRWGLAVGLSLGGAAGVLAILLNPTWLERITPPGGKPLLTPIPGVSAS